MSVDPMPQTRPAGTDLLRLGTAEPPPATVCPVGPREPSGHRPPQPPQPRGAVGRDRLTGSMVEFAVRQRTAFVATADAEGECDSGLWSGPPGFIRVLDDRRIACAAPDPLPGLGNLGVNPNIGLLMVDAGRGATGRGAVGLQVNGRARVVDATEPGARRWGLPTGGEVQRWVVVDVTEAYLHSRAVAG
ncbi:pyridoxamine 5'-phosphate oxidase family protein [Actinokineospora auranticolor]|uniref:pyridoxamine 5'-phosphate oxidase family protein n=1 Tax=Actinokineospora auranticolor TaxID=155976 RepID=UPI0015E29350|nr:pyridoxamine 5'-phosphate oxidase family protein [Actinokineospora auranticolor]